MDKQLTAGQALTKAAGWLDDSEVTERGVETEALYVARAQAYATYALALITNQNGGTVTVRSEGSF